MEHLIFINSLVVEFILNDEGNNVIKFENGYRIVFNYYTDCCAEFYLDNITDVFQEGKYIGAIKLCSDKNGKSWWLKTYDMFNEEIDAKPFYSTSNGWYAPSINMEVYNKFDELVFEMEMCND